MEMGHSQLKWVSEIPLTYVNHCNTAKTEVTLEFALNDDAPVNLAEMRFNIPSKVVWRFGSS